MSMRRATKRLPDRLLQRLAEAGILDRQRTEVLGLFPTTRWPTRDAAPEAELRERVRRALVDGTTPTERTATVIGLADAVGLVRKLFPDADRRLVKERTQAIAEGEWAADTVRQVIRETEAVIATMAATAATGGAVGGS